MPDPDRPVYEATLDIDVELGVVVGDVSIDFTPDLDIDDLVLRLWPNGPRTANSGVSVTIDSLTVDGDPLDVVLETPTLARVNLPQPHAAGTTLTVAFGVSVSVPRELNARVSADGAYMRLGTVLPLLPWQPGEGWATEAPTSLFAEAVVSPSADWAVTMNVSEPYEVLASGMPDDEGVWRLEAGRDFAITVGDFDLVEQTVLAPDPVRIVVGASSGFDEDPGAYLAKIANSLEQFSERWGPYPWPSLTVALTPELRGGIEFPTHIMQGPGTIGRTTSHEVAHMYFYSLVGNNQARDPWLDEGLASYGEFTYEGSTGSVFTPSTDGFGLATMPMSFWEDRSQTYYRAVYAQLANALAYIGSTEDIDCALARYVADNAFAVADPEDLIAAFEPTFPDIRAQLELAGVVIADAD